MGQNVRKATTNGFTKSATEADDCDLVRRAFGVLQDLGVQATLDGKLPPNHPADYAGILQRGAKRAPYNIEVKRTLRPSTVGPLILRLQNLKPPVLLLTDYATPPVAKLLRDAGIAFADTAGNAHLKLAGDIYYVVGNLPARTPKAKKAVRAFQPAGLRAMFAMLCMPELISLPTRELATRLHVANGTVSRVMNDLNHLGFATTLGRRNRRLHNLQGLLERWVMMYPTQLRPSLLRQRLAADSPDWWKKEKFDSGQVVLGGEPAAERLTGYLKAGAVTLYVRGAPRPLNEIIAKHGLRMDPAGNVEVLDAFWPQGIPAQQPGLAPTPLIYADLLATGDGRALETAKRIYDDYLAERFSAS